MNAPSFPELVLDGGITLRPIVRSDAAAVFALIKENREHLGAWMSFARRTATVHDTSAFIDAAVEEMGRGRMLCCVVRVNGSPAGLIDLHNIDLENRVAEMGYWLAQHATGQGVMTASARALCRFAFTALRLHRVELLAAVENVPSRRVAERLGMTFEAILRDRLYLNGRFYNGALYVAFAG